LELSALGIGASVEKLPKLSAVSYGPEAVALAHESGEVHGVVSKGVYLYARSGALVGLVDSREADGPVTVRVLGLNGALALLKHSHGQAFQGNGSTVQIAGKLEIDLKQALQWTPPAVRLEGDSSTLDESIRALHSVIYRRGARGGLASLADLAFRGRATPAPGIRSMSDGEDALRAAKIQDSTDPLLRQAGRSMEGLIHSWRAGKVDSAREAAMKLLGLGPGLTPSGDDLLAGLLAVCRWSRQWLKGAGARQTLAVCEAVVEAVVAEAPAGTTRLSARLLAYAADGILYEPAMSLGARLFAGRSVDIEPAALRLFALGHTSGTDMAVGILLGVVLNHE
jgi:Protein of unknown function (DUF2877)